MLHNRSEQQSTSSSTGHAGLQRLGSVSSVVKSNGGERNSRNLGLDVRLEVAC
jgi:hypothetical protein